MTDIPNDISLEKTDFSCPNRYQIERSFLVRGETFCLVSLCSVRSLSDLNLCGVSMHAATVLLCLEDAVPLELSTTSNSYNLSVASSA